MIRRDLHEENRISWNAATVAHNSHKRDQARFFRQGGSTLFPEGQIVNQDQIINITAIITGAFFLITLLYLLLRMDRERLDEINARASAGIPWDAIVVILLGALVVGLGIGLMIFLNRPV